MLLQSNIGSPELWADTGGLFGLVLMVLCLLMIALFGLLAWVFKRTVKNNDETNKQIIKTIHSLQQEISENTLQVTKPLVEVNLRIIQLHDFISGINSKFKERDDDLAGLMKKVREEFEDFKTHIAIINETIKNIRKD